MKKLSTEEIKGLFQESNEGLISIETTVRTDFFALPQEVQKSVLSNGLFGSNAVEIKSYSLKGVSPEGGLLVSLQAILTEEFISKLDSNIVNESVQGSSIVLNGPLSIEKLKELASAGVTEFFTNVNPFFFNLPIEHQKHFARKSLCKNPDLVINISSLSLCPSNPTNATLLGLKITIVDLLQQLESYESRDSDIAEFYRSLEVDGFTRLREPLSLEEINRIKSDPNRVLGEFENEDDYIYSYLVEVPYNDIVAADEGSIVTLIFSKITNAFRDLEPHQIELDHELETINPFNKNLIIRVTGLL